MRLSSALLCALVAGLASASPSCCDGAVAGKVCPPYEVPDPTDRLDRQSRWVPDPAANKPDGWDDEEDGAWTPELIKDPDFVPPPVKMVPNPSFSYWCYAEAWGEAVTRDVLDALPWVMAGVGVTAAFKLAAPVLPVHLLVRRGDSGTAATLAAVCRGALLGILTPLCSCGVLPVAAGLAADGAAVPAVVAFVTASQSAGIDSAFLTWGMLGPLACLCRLAAAALLAVAAGMASAVADPGPPARPSSPASASAPAKAALAAAAAAAARPWHQHLCNAVLVSADCLIEVMPSVLLGIGTSAALMQATPSLKAAVTSLAVGRGGGAAALAGRVAVLTFVLPLQLCEHATVALAAGIQKAGGSPGLAFAFLLVAPATNLATLLLLVDTKRRRNAIAASCCAAAAAAAGAPSAAAAAGAVKQAGGPAAKRSRSKSPAPKSRAAAPAAAAAAAAAAAPSAPAPTQPSSPWATAVRIAAALVATALALSYAVDAAGVDLLVEQEAVQGHGAMFKLPLLAEQDSLYAALGLIVVAIGVQELYAGQVVAAAQQQGGKKKTE